MNVTRKNFSEVLPFVKSCIQDADFLAIDGEFTGISANRDSDLENCYDTLEERYEKTVKGSVDFLMMQFGLSTFRYEKGSDEYVSNSFNFYLFPVPFSRQAPDCKFLCQASSIDFLVTQGFDFNKTFQEGISYLSYQDEMKMRLRLQQRHDLIKASSPAFTSPLGIPNSSMMKSPAVVPDEQKIFLRATLDGIKKFLSNCENSNLDLPPCSAFQRKLIYQTASLEFGSKIFLETVTLNNRERYIRVSRLKCDSDIKQKELERQASEVGEVDNAVGFTQVVKAMSKSGKLIVGHNMFLDLIHMVHQFHVPLPDHYDQFKSVLNCLFPQVCDTKLMSSMHPFKEQIAMTGLSDLNKYLEIKPFRRVKLAQNSAGTEYKINVENLHEAGYDAFITGLCFIRMANHLGTFQSPVLQNITPNSALLKPFINKIYIMKIADIPYMDIVGTDLNPSRDNVFHVKVHESKHWTYADIRHQFSVTGILSVGWIDDTSFFVGIPHDNMELISSLKPSGTCTVTSYSSFKAIGRESRKRSFEMIDRTDAQVSNALTTNLNVNAEPFISRSNSPAPDEFHSESLNEVSSKRARIDDDQENDSLLEKTYTSETKIDPEKSGNDSKLFEVPDDW